MMMFLAVREFVVRVPVPKVDTADNARAIKRKDRAIDRDRVDRPLRPGLLNEPAKTERFSFVRKGREDRTAGGGHTVARGPQELGQISHERHSILDAIYLQLFFALLMAHERGSPLPYGIPLSTAPLA